MLSEGGHGSIAYKMMTNTAYPGWQYPLTQGAAAVWERWDSYTETDGFGSNNSMNRFNHYSHGSGHHRFEREKSAKEEREEIRC